jgi:multiple sugar transport system permease protein
VTGLARDRLRGYLLLSPAALLLFGVALVPIAATAVQSAYRLILVFHEEHFIGLGNYRFLLRDGRFWSALGTTAYFAFLSVAFEVVLGLAFAILLDGRALGRGAERGAAGYSRVDGASRALLRAAVLLPWAIPSAIAAKIWSWLYNPDYGLVQRLLPGDANWLGTPGLALHAAILVDVWKTTPFVALLLYAALRNIPEDLHRAAAIDGASAIRTFRSITLPLLRPAILVAMILRTLDAFRVFDSVYVLTGGGPANTTETLSIYTYKTLMNAGDFGYGSTLAVATFLTVLAVSLIYLRFYAREAAA